MLFRIFRWVSPASRFKRADRLAFYAYIAARAKPVLNFVYLIGGVIPIAYLTGDLMVENKPADAVLIRTLYLCFWLVLYCLTFLTPKRLPIRFSYPLYTLVGVSVTCMIEGSIFGRPEYILATSLLYLIGLVISYASPLLIAICGTISVIVPAILLPNLGVAELDWQRVVFFHLIWATVCWLASSSILRLNIRLFRAEQKLKAAHQRNEEALQQELLLRQEIEEQAKTDPLTGLYNRREFYRQAERALEVAHRHQRPLALLLLDIDLFKQINDQHGHITGDKVLSHIAGLCRSSIRRSDILARFGGEEFVLLLPETTPEQALEFAERLRTLVEQTRISDNHNNRHRVTISIGVAAYHQQSHIDQLISKADTALYAAKHAGRNLVREAVAG